MSDGKCSCGWEFPLSAIAYPNGTVPGPATFVPGVYVAMLCPICMRGHAFVNALDPETENEEAKKYQAAHKGMA